MNDIAIFQLRAYMQVLNRTLLALIAEGEQAAGKQVELEMLLDQ
jgi:hypothetical protein